MYIILSIYLILKDGRKKERTEEKTRGRSGTDGDGRTGINIRSPHERKNFENLNSILKQDNYWRLIRPARPTYNPPTEVDVNI